MKKHFLSGWKKSLFTALTCGILILIGAVLIRSYNMTPEKHLIIGTELLQKNASQTLIHYKLAQKSSNKATKKLALMKLANLYHHGGKGLESNIPKAAFYYEQLAQEEDPHAFYYLALFYDAGDKVPENREKAMDYMKKAAQVLPEAKYGLGVWMERGYYGAVSMDQVVKLYTEAAEAGFINAMKSLISIYHGGYSGFPQNLKLENYWRTQFKNGCR